MEYEKVTSAAARPLGFSPGNDDWRLKQRAERVTLFERGGPLTERFPCGDTVLLQQPDAGLAAVNDAWTLARKGAAQAHPSVPIGHRNHTRCMDSAPLASLP